MNIKNRQRQTFRILFVSLWIMLGMCHTVKAWQPDFYYRDFDKDTVWGKETNCVKAGLLLQYAPNTNRTFVGFFPVLYDSCGTNTFPDEHEILWLWLPPFDSRYQMTLTDTNGMTVAKTAKGNALGKPIDQPLRLHIGMNFQAGYRGRILHVHSPDLIPTDPFVLEDYFNITNAGKYHLKFEMVVVWPTEQNPTNAVHLPPVDAEIEIKNP